MFIAFGLHSDIQLLKPGRILKSGSDACVVCCATVLGPPSGCWVKRWGWGAVGVLGELVSD